ncbi:alpha-L-fucosidase-like isoform X2 [Orbicella faveolata]|uniref:alpha-L-fucosidase-like isoform X2 n=1 Tax=Orbicella faveolata TaxID=48498 RepID=UPI0009E38B61|nr:alpha-L-fucosidase-like isoform X2 [Orbicella faveolata]
MFTFVVTLLLFVSQFSRVQAKYEATWKSLDSRPLPSWYDEAKFGIFMHWGVFSVPSFDSEWFWWYWKGQNNPKCVEFMKKNYRPGFSYADFAPMFRAEFFDPDLWADLLARSGARYVVLTSKHHEGWTNWKSNVSWNWNSVDNGPHRDLVGDLASSIRKRTNVTFGLYYSLYEWFHPLYLKDKENNFTTQEYVDEIMLPQMHDIVNTYKPSYVWTDGDWEASDKYWNSTEFLAWLYNDSPVKDTVVVNDRWGAGDRCHHGGVFTCHDRYNPGVLQKHKWENCMTVDKKSWGYRRNTTLADFLTIDDLTSILASTVSCGGNMLMNIGPTADGRIDPIFQERLEQMGDWLKVNGEGIYGTKPWRAQNDTITPNIWYTSKPGVTYAIVLDWPKTDTLTLGVPIPTEATVITLLGLPDVKFPWKQISEYKGVIIAIPPLPVSDLPCQWAWVFRMTYVQ